MSRLRERKEKKCLNCGQTMHGRYCHHCGQENIETAENAWSLLSHYFKDITHFDGKFFVTIKALFRKPGLLPLEYMNGHRAGYLNPVRMYVFTSAFFFLIFFSITKPDINNEIVSIQAKPNLGEGKREPNSNGIILEIGEESNLTKEESFPYDSIRSATDSLLDGITTYKTKGAYDSALALGIEKDNFFTRMITYKKIEIYSKFRNDLQGSFKKLISMTIHSFPQILFFSLPLFALFLKLLYLRKNKYFFVHHLLFTVYLYIWIFMALLAFLLLNTIGEAYNLTWMNFPLLLIVMYIFYYEYRSMLNFYGEGKGKTFLKFLLLNLYYLVINIFLFVFFLFISVLKI